jgi:tetratricopeptide (TPR) repeat protein
VLRPALAAVLLVTSGCSDWRGEQIYHQATELGARGRWNEALHHYERLWVQVPQHARTNEARLQAARIYAGPARKPRSAEEQYREILLRSTDEAVRSAAAKELATLYERDLGQPDRAAEVLEAWRQRTTDDLVRAEASVRLAKLHLQSGRLLQALQEAEPWSREASPADLRPRALVVMAQARELARAVSAATETYAKAVEQASEGSDVWIAALEGEVRMLEEAGRWADAIEQLGRLRAGHPNPEALGRWEIAIRERQAEVNR